MSKSSMRIVLVDPLGDVLFSGESVIATDAEAEAEELCPETKRSATSESGIFAAVSYDDSETDSGEIRTSRTHAA